MGDDSYFCAPGSLSDFESTTIAPRHIQKIFTLCALYAVRFQIVLKSFLPGGDFLLPWHRSDACTISFCDGHRNKKDPAPFQLALARTVLLLI